MKFTSLSSAQAARLVQLVQEKETLLAKLSQVDRALSALESGSGVALSAPSSRRRGRPVGSGRGARKPGKLKTGILEALKAAGPKGITVKDLTKKLKVKPNNVFSWFYTTGRKVQGLKKVGPARYALTK